MLGEGNTNRYFSPQYRKMAFWEAFFLLNHKVVWVGGEN